MKLGITGAFGFLGANIVAEALRQGYEVVAFASRRREHPLFATGDVETRDLRLDGGRISPDALKGIDALVNAAGSTSFMPQDKRLVWQVNVLGALALCDVALRVGLSRVVDLSSVNAIGSVRGIEADEDNAMAYDSRYPSMFSSPEEALAVVDASARGDFSFLGRSRVMYFDSKVAAYEASRRCVREHGLPLVTVFPGTAVGPGDMNGGISHLIDLVWEGKLGLAPAGSTSYMDSRDFARGVLLALRGGRIGQGYILAGKKADSMSYADFMSLVARQSRIEDGESAAKVRPRVLWSPVTLAGSILAERFLPSLGLSGALALSGALGQSYSSAKAIGELGYAPDTDLSSSISDCRAFSLRNGSR